METPPHIGHVTGPSAGFVARRNESRILQKEQFVKLSIPKRRYTLKKEQIASFSAFKTNAQKKTFSLNLEYMINSELLMDF